MLLVCTYSGQKQSVIKTRPVLCHPSTIVGYILILAAHPELRLFNWCIFLPQLSLNCLQSFVEGDGSRKFRPEAEILGILSIGAAPKARIQNKKSQTFADSL